MEKVLQICKHNINNCLRMYYEHPEVQRRMLDSRYTLYSTNPLILMPEMKCIQSKRRMGKVVKN